jgi:hypothetical protein
MPVGETGDMVMLSAPALGLVSALGVAQAVPNDATGA